MATFRVTDPNSGRVMNLTGDSPPTQQELEQVFAQFEVEQQPQIDPNILAKSPEFQRQQAAETLARSVGPAEALAIGAGRGLTTVGRGLGLADPEDPAATRAFKALQEQRPITTTTGEVLGEAAPFLIPGTAVGAGVGLGGRVALSGALGATEAGVLARGKDATSEEVAISAGLGGTLAGAAEVVLPVIGRLGGRLIRRTLGTNAPAFGADGNITPDFQKALDSSGLTIDDVQEQAQRQIDAGEVSDPAALLRKQFLEDQGLTGRAGATRAQATGIRQEFVEQQELAKGSSAVSDRLGAQEEVLATRFENAITATGGSANQSNSPVFDFIADKSIAQDAAISNAYKAARAAAGDQKIVKLTGLSEQMGKIAGSDKITGGLVGAVKDILIDKGVLGKKGFRIVGKIDPAQAEEVRIAMNSLHKSLPDFGKQKLAAFKNALDSDVAAAVGEDVFKDARASKAKFERDLSRTRINKFDSRRKEVVRDILENKIGPDELFDKVVVAKSSRPEDIIQVRDFLLLDGKTGPGAEAWDDLRAEAMQRIRNDSVLEVGGEPALSRDKLEKALKKTFGDAKLKALFTPQERKFLNDMLKVANIREPRRGTFQGKGPTGVAVGELKRAVQKIGGIVAAPFSGIAENVQGRLILIPPSQRAALQPSQAARAIPLALPAIPAALAAQEQQ